jgi:hypothetical protein
MAGAGAWALLAIALAAGDGWRQVADGKVRVYSRAGGERVTELRAEAQLLGTPAEVKALLEDENYSRNYSHVAEERILLRPEPRAWVKYTRLHLPLLSDRDTYLLYTRVQDLGPDGSGRYRLVWHTWAAAPPERPGVVRIPVNEGSWEVSPGADPDHCRVVLFLHFDPGGEVPAWLAEVGERQELPRLMHALEEEVLRRRTATGPL